YAEPGFGVDSDDYAPVNSWNSVYVLEKDLQEDVNEDGRLDQKVFLIYGPTQWLSFLQGDSTLIESAVVRLMKDIDFAELDEKDGTKDGRFTIGDPNKISWIFSSFRSTIDGHNFAIRNLEMNFPQHNAG